MCRCSAAAAAADMIVLAREYFRQDDKARLPARGQERCRFNFYVAMNGRNASHDLD
jgi:hypothetical protein